MKKSILVLACLFCSLSSYAAVYAVVVGISRYANADMNLNSADKDAASFYNYLLLSNKSENKANFTLLLNEDATQANVFNAMQMQFRKATSNDRLIFYFSGHGGRGYFYSYNSNTSKLLYHEQIRNIFKNSQGNFKLCIADACHAGSIRPVKSRNVQGLNSRQSDVIVFMSSRPEQSSKESFLLKNGLFTYYLLEAMKGRADENKDYAVTAREMYFYVRRNVMRETQNQQTPQMFGTFDQHEVMCKYR